MVFRKSRYKRQSQCQQMISIPLPVTRKTTFTKIVVRSRANLLRRADPMPRSRSILPFLLFKEGCHKINRESKMEAWKKNRGCNTPRGRSSSTFGHRKHRQAGNYPLYKKYCLALPVRLRIRRPSPAITIAAPTYGLALPKQLRLQRPSLTITIATLHGCPSPGIMRSSICPGNTTMAQKGRAWHQN